MSAEAEFDTVSEAAVEAYERDGAVCLRRIFAPRWLELLAAGVERNLAEPGPFAKRYTPEGAPGLFFGDYCNWRRIPEYRAFMLESPAAETAGRLMRASRVNLFHEHVLVKEPGTPERTPWHQDQPYWSVDGHQVCSIWLPLDRVPQATCAEFVAGSHRWGEWYTPRRFVDNQDHPANDPGFRAVPDVDAQRDQYRILAWDLEPGDCIVFHALTLHGAPGNRLPSRRRAYASRWTGDDARFVLRSGFMSPPPPPDAPAPGGPMDSDAFPVVWPPDRREGADAGAA
jgi:ectoine hydroxylase-related dioxygenase (phytanoyl-CoA dioxygenase family)